MRSAAKGGGGAMSHEEHSHWLIVAGSSGRIGSSWQARQGALAPRGLISGAIKFGPFGPFGSIFKYWLMRFHPCPAPVCPLTVLSASRKWERAPGLSGNSKRMSRSFGRLARPPPRWRKWAVGTGTGDMGRRRAGVVGGASEGGGGARGGGGGGGGRGAFSHPWRAS